MLESPEAITMVVAVQVKSTQYKKLVPNASRFTHQNLKSCKSHEKNETKNIELLVFSFSSINLAS